MFLTAFELLAMPIAIIVVGLVLFYLKPKHRRLIGSVLIVLGVLNMAIAQLRYPFFVVGFTFYIDFMIILLGIVSLFYSIDRVSKK